MLHRLDGTKPSYRERSKRYLKRGGSHFAPSPTAPLRHRPPVCAGAPRTRIPLKKKKPRQPAGHDGAPPMDGGEGAPSRGTRRASESRASDRLAGERREAGCARNTRAPREAPRPSNGGTKRGPHDTPRAPIYTARCGFCGKQNLSPIWFSPPRDKIKCPDRRAIQIMRLKAQWGQKEKRGVPSGTHGGEKPFGGKATQ